MSLFFELNLYGKISTCAVGCSLEHPTPSSIRKIRATAQVAKFYIKGTRYSISFYP